MRARGWPPTWLKMPPSGIRPSNFRQRPDRANDVGIEVRVQAVIGPDPGNAPTRLPGKGLESTGDDDAAIGLDDEGPDRTRRAKVQRVDCSVGQHACQPIAGNSLDLAKATADQDAMIGHRREGEGEIVCRRGPGVFGKAIGIQSSQTGPGQARPGQAAESLHYWKPLAKMRSVTGRWNWRTLSITLLLPPTCR